MSFDWREFLNLARLLKDEPYAKCNKESAYRTAVSRAYYAAFCHARNYARDNQGYTSIKDEDDHKNIRKHFRLYNMYKIAQWLDNLRVWRNQCDYDDVIIDEEARDINILTNVAVDRVQKVLAELSKTTD